MAASRPSRGLTVPNYVEQKVSAPKFIKVNGKQFGKQYEGIVFLGRWYFEDAETLENVYHIWYSDGKYDTVMPVDTSDVVVVDDLPTTLQTPIVPGHVQEMGDSEDELDDLLALEGLDLNATGDAPAVAAAPSSSAAATPKARPTPKPKSKRAAYADRIDRSFFHPHTLMSTDKYEWQGNWRNFSPPAGSGSPIQSAPSDAWTFSERVSDFISDIVTPWDFSKLVLRDEDVLWLLRCVQRDADTDLDYLTVDHMWVWIAAVICLHGDVVYREQRDAWATGEWSTPSPVAQFISRDQYEAILRNLTPYPPTGRPATGEPGSVM